MKIAILGGSFDPPHIGHILLAMQVKEFLSFDQVWLMPVHKHPFEKTISPDETRFQMLKLLENNELKISELEMKKDSVSYTIDTLRTLQKNSSSDSFTWIIGSDQLKSFQKWKEWKKIINDFGLIVFPRAIPFENLDDEVMDCLALKQIPSSIKLMNMKGLITTNVSSTLIRARRKERKSISYLVPKEVEEYIIEHKLYE